jgi:hypothetical protein
MGCRRLIQPASRKMMKASGEGFELTGQV